MKDSIQQKAPPQQQRAIAKRATLIVAVKDIVAREGAEAVTTTRVAAEAGTAVGTIYRYFPDRDAMLLAAFDDSVERLVQICREELHELPNDTPLEDAARQLLGVYLAAAESIPAHAGLLKAMRLLRPIAEEHSPDIENVIAEVIAPFFFRFAPALQVTQLQFQLIGTVLSTLVDLYLVSPQEQERGKLRDEIEAHLMFMIRRIG
jgi:AcrR family transcriptional regulator